MKDCYMCEYGSVGNKPKTISKRIGDSVFTVNQLNGGVTCTNNCVHEINITNGTFSCSDFKERSF